MQDLLIGQVSLRLEKFRSHHKPSTTPRVRRRLHAGMKLDLGNPHIVLHLLIKLRQPIPVIVLKCRTLKLMEDGVTYMVPSSPDLLRK